MIVENEDDCAVSKGFVVIDFLRINVVEVFLKNRLKSMQDVVEM